MSWTPVTKMQGSKGNVYNISFDYGTRQYGCSCPAWSKNMPREDCKHILKYKLGLAQSMDQAISSPMAPQPESVKNKRIIRRG